jgi:RNA polymerase sigma-70 factor, ECF subfamily
LNIASDNAAEGSAAERSGAADLAEETLLVERARAGDTAAFADLYRAHHRRVYALTLRLTADTGRAEELTQDAFVNAWRRLPDFRGDARFSTWLHRIAVNVVVSYQRRNRPWIAWLRDSEALPEVAVESDEALTRDLDRAIARLPQRARQVFVLVEVEGYSHEETGRMLGMAVGTSKAHLFRARSLLREWLT